MVRSVPAKPGRVSNHARRAMQRNSCPASLLDRIQRGHVGWNIVTSANLSEARNFAHEAHSVWLLQLCRPSLAMSSRNDPTVVTVYPAPGMVVICRSYIFANP